MRIKIFKYIIPLAIALGTFRVICPIRYVDRYQPGLQANKSGEGRYFGALRLGYSMVLDNRTNMSYSWREYLDFPVIGLYSANPGLPVSLSATLHQFLFAFLPVGLPLFKSLAVYAFAEPVGYMFKLFNDDNDPVGESWYSTGGFEIGTGGVFLSVGVQYFYRHNRDGLDSTGRAESIFLLTGLKKINYLSAPFANVLNNLYRPISIPYKNQRLPSRLRDDRCLLILLRRTACELRRRSSEH